MRKSPQQTKRRNQRKDEFPQAIGLTDKEVLSVAIPVVHRGRSGGSRTLCQGKRSYQTSYTMSNQEESITFDVLVIRKYTKGILGGVFSETEIKCVKKS